MKTYPALHVSATRVVLAIALAGSCAFAQSGAKDAAPGTAAAVPQSAAADANEAGQETELPPVTVSAHDGLAVPYDQTGVSVSILDSGKLQKQEVATLSDALTRVPGVYAMPGGGAYQYGNVSQISIRGMSDKNYTLAMVDGMRLYRPQHLSPSANFLGQSMLFGMGDIEVVKGAQGAVYGGGAIGGMVNTATPQGKGEPSVKVFNEYGTNDTYNGHIIAQGAEGKWDWFVAAGYNRTNNDLNYEPGIALNKHQGKFTQWEEAVRMGYQVSDNTKVTLTYRRQDAERYERNTSDGNTDYTYKTNLTTAKIESKINNVWDTSLMAGYYGWDPTFGADEDKGMRQTHVSLRNVQIEWRNALHWNEANTTTAGLSWYRSEYNSEWEARNLENQYSVFAEHLYKPLRSWDNSFAVRLDHSTVWNNLFTYRYATSWKVTGENSKTRVFGSFGSGYRSPTQFERFANHSVPTSYSGWNTTYRYVGNPDLSIERSLSGDLGVEQRVADGHYASITGFWTRINNPISTDSVGYNADGEYEITYKNGSYATSVGIELALRGDFDDAWNTGYSIGYTYTVPKNSEDKQLEDTARSVWSAEVHTSPVESVTTGIGLVAASGRTGGTDGFHVDNYCVLRWYARWQATENLAFHVRVENMLNDHYVTYQTYSSYYRRPNTGTISAGAAVYAGCTLTF